MNRIQVPDIHSRANWIGETTDGEEVKVVDYFQTEQGDTIAWTTTDDWMTLECIPEKID